MNCILDQIGNTPLINIYGIWCKLEMFNPSGSIKDRIAYEMIKAANLRKGDTVIEATSGNTGVSVAFVAAAMGLHSHIVCPRTTSELKIKLIKQYGGSVWQKDLESRDATIEECINIANQLASPTDAVITSPSKRYLSQFTNPANTKAQKQMAIEINNTLLRQFQELPNCIVAGTGTGGTLAALNKVFPDAYVYQVLPDEGDHIEGIADGVDTPLLKDVPYSTIRVSAARAKSTAQMLCRTYGVNCGISSGANYYAATKLRMQYKNVVTIFPDAGYRYDL